MELLFYRIVKIHYILLTLTQISKVKLENKKNTQKVKNKCIIRKGLRKYSPS